MIIKCGSCNAIVGEQKGSFFYFGEEKSPLSFLGKWTYKVDEGVINITCKCGNKIDFDVRANTDYKKR
jgi:hypothetical protein